MSGTNKYPDIEKELDPFYVKTPKWMLMEMVRDYALQLNGEDNIKEAVKEIKDRAFLLHNDGGRQ